MTISLVTACLNAASTIGDALESASSQTLRPEVIVADGGSRDATLETVARFPHVVGRVLAGPDRGLYDAINKGIAAAQGEVVGILHADDTLAHPRVLEEVADALARSGADCCYGDLVVVRREDPREIVRTWRAGAYSPARFYQGWMPPHPTFFARRELFARWGGYRLDFGSAADYELLIRFLLVHRARAAYVPDVLVHMRAGGASNVSLRARLKAHRFDRMAWKVNDLRPRFWTLAAKPLFKVPQFFRRGQV